MLFDAEQSPTHAVRAAHQERLTWAEPFIDYDGSAGREAPTTEIWDEPAGSGGRVHCGLKPISCASDAQVIPKGSK